MTNLILKKKVVRKDPIEKIRLFLQSGIISLVVSNKGGTGKSTFCLFLISYLKAMVGAEALLVADLDRGVQSTLNAHRGEVDVTDKAYLTEERAGNVAVDELFEPIAAEEKQNIAVDTAASSEKAMGDYMNNSGLDTVDGLGIRMIYFCVSKPTVECYSEFLKVIQEYGSRVKIVWVHNLHEHDERDWQIFEEQPGVEELVSQVHQEVERHRIPIVLLPAIPTQNFQTLRNRHLSLDAALTDRSLKVAERVRFRNLRINAFESLDRAFDTLIQQ